MRNLLKRFLGAIAVLMLRLIIPLIIRLLVRELEAARKRDDVAAINNLRGELRRYRIRLTVLKRK